MIGIALEQDWLTLLGLAFAVTAAGAMLLFTERHQDEWVEEEVQRLETEHARLSDQLITAEQEERRRLALFLHDGPVQSMSGIALMLDGVIDAVEEDRIDEAKQVLGSALEKQRQTIRSLRDLSFELEPVVLRDQGFGRRRLLPSNWYVEQHQIDLATRGGAPDRARFGSSRRCTTRSGAGRRRASWFVSERPPRTASRL